MHISYLNNLWFKSGGVKQKAQGPKWASKDSNLLNWTALKNVNYRNVCFVGVFFFCFFIVSRQYKNKLIYIYIFF